MSVVMLGSTTLKLLVYNDTRGRQVVKAHNYKTVQRTSFFERTKIDYILGSDREGSSVCRHKPYGVFRWSPKVLVRISAIVTLHAAAHTNWDRHRTMQGQLQKPQEQGDSAIVGGIGIAGIGKTQPLRYPVKNKHVCP